MSYAVAQAAAFAYQLMATGQLHIPAELGLDAPRVERALLESLSAASSPAECLRALGAGAQDVDLVPFEESDDPHDVYGTLMWLLNESAERELAVGVLVTSQARALCVCGVESVEHYVVFDAQTQETFSVKRPTFEFTAYLEQHYGDARWDIVQLVERAEPEKPKKPASKKRARRTSSAVKKKIKKEPEAEAE